MAAPNIVSVSSIYGKTAVLVVPATATAIVTNASGSNKVLKVNALMVANIDTANPFTFNLELYRGTTAYRMAFGMSVPATSSIDFLNKAIYLEEGDSLRIAGSTASKLEAVASYEEIG